MHSTTRHAAVEASNKLYSGEVTDFREAMRLVIRGMFHEHAEAVKWNESLGPDEQEYRWTAEPFSSFDKAAREALALYNQEVEAAEKRVIEALRARKDNDLNNIADALESGDYSGLAW